MRSQPVPPLQLTLDTERRPHGVVTGTVRLDARTPDGGYQNLLRPAFDDETVVGVERGDYAAFLVFARVHLVRPRGASRLTPSDLRVLDLLPSQTFD